MYTDVIIPVDGSESSFRVLPIAASLARRFKAKPHILAAWGDLPSAIMTVRINEAVEAVAGDFESLDHSLVLERQDRPIADIIYNTAMTYAEPLVCMSTHGRGRSAALVGSVVAETLEKLPNPIVLAGPDCVAQPISDEGRLLICTDGTDFADSILPVATDFAKALGLQTEVVTVVDPRDLEAAEQSLGAGNVPSGAEASHVSHVAKGLADATGSASGFEVLHGEHPAKEILSYVADSQPALIAMATRDEYRLKRIVEGSVTANVARHATCPVLTVRPADA